MREIIILVFLTCILCGCDSNRPKTTVISGNIVNLKNDTIHLIQTDKIFPGLKILHKKSPSTLVDSLGNFKFRVNNLKTDYYQIVKGKYRRLYYDLHIENGDSIHIVKPKWNSSDSLVISGSVGSKFNCLMNDYNNHFLGNNFYTKIRSNEFKTEIDFKNYVDSFFLKRKQALLANESTPDYLKKYYSMKLSANKAQLLLDHLERRNYYMSGSSDYFYPAESYFNSLSELDYSSSEDLPLEVKSMANSYLNYKARNAFRDKTKKEWYDESFKWKLDYIKQLPPSQWKDIVALSNIVNFSTELGDKNFFNNVSSLTDNNDSFFTKKINQELFDNNVNPYLQLAPNNEAPDFELPDANGVKHKLSDYKGKIVYIDFWGTWCYYCIKEIPDAIKLQAKYADDPVVFMYVSMEYDENDIENWKNFILGKNKKFAQFLNQPFPGLHLVADKQMNNKEIEPYKINAAPSYVLIDHKGRIVHARAKSSKNVSEDIDVLLKNMK